MQRGLLLQGALLATAVITQRDHDPGLAIGAASVGAQLITQRNSREAELESDHYGMTYMSRAGYDPQAAVTLQETFVRLAEQNGGEGGKLEALFASHPPSTERVEKNRAMVAMLPKGGDVGRERYQAATATLRQRAPAYKAYDDARMALAEKKPGRSERLAQQAVKLVPNEAQFHGLLGDIDVSQKRYDDAIKHYGDAIARNDNFFYYHLQRLSHRALRQWDSATTEPRSQQPAAPHGRGGIRARHDRGAARRSREGAGALCARGAVRQRSRRGRAGRDRASRPARESRQVPRGAWRSRRARATDRGAREPDARDRRRRHGRRSLRGRARRVREVNRRFTGDLARARAPLVTGLGPFTSTEAYQVGVAEARVVTD
jgi:hypothetical protein